MAASLLLFAVPLMPPQQMLEAALNEVEPPPALRAAFRATLTSDGAVRKIEFDPYAPTDQQFRLISRQGANEELDAIVEGWKAERQADVRLFADDLRSSLGEARAVMQGAALAVAFRHQINSNDGPIDAAISANMIGQLTFDDVSGFLKRIDYAILKPVKLDDGTTLKQYQQTYSFGHSDRWGVSYVTGYEVQATGGRWGFEESRAIRVVLTDIAFGLAGDARQEVASKPVPSTRTTASR